MRAIRALRCRFLRRLRALGRDRGGAAAVEFAMVAGPFLFLMMAIIEIAMTFWTNQVLETATQIAARQIYTGAFQTATANQSQTAAVLAQRFKTLLCANVTALFDCPNSVSIDIRSVASFSTASVPPMIVAGAYNTSGFGYQTVARSTIALVTASMNVQPLTRIFGGTPGLSDGSRILMSTAVFETEPY